MIVTFAKLISGGRLFVEKLLNVIIVLKLYFESQKPENISNE